jgi:hypothetical protein
MQILLSLSLLCAITLSFRVKLKTMACIMCYWKSDAGDTNANKILNLKELPHLKAE